MSLNLNEFLIEDEEILFGKLKLIVSADLPARIIEKFADLASMDKGQIDKKSISMTIDLIKTILYTKNEKIVVDDFAENLSILNLKKVTMFISEYITKNLEDKKKTN